VDETLTYAWRGDLTDGEMVDLVVSHGGKPSPGWWDQIRSFSLGWVTARSGAGILVGFVNVEWDGAITRFSWIRRPGEVTNTSASVPSWFGWPRSKPRQPVVNGFTSTFGPSWRPSTSRRVDSVRPMQD
jgi:hypothetical protein